MAEKGARRPAGSLSALQNLLQLEKEEDYPGGAGASITAKLRKELEEKGIKGFKRGGVVKKTGLAKVHKGERVLTAKQAKARTSSRRAKR